MTLGELLKDARARQGMSMQDLADAIGSTKSHIYSIEAERTEPGFMFAVRLSVALGLPLQSMGAAMLNTALAKENKT